MGRINYKAAEKDGRMVKGKARDDVFIWNEEGERIDGVKWKAKERECSGY